MDTCRICLSKSPQNNIQQLQTSKKDGQKDYLEIMLFCLDIHITEESLNLSKKLCSKCFKKVLLFYEFKTLALKNDAYLKSLAQETVVKDEVRQSDDEVEVFYGDGDTTSENNEPAVKIEFDEEASNHGLDPITNAMDEIFEIETKELGLDEHNWDLLKDLDTNDTVKEELGSDDEVFYGDGDTTGENNEPAVNIEFDNEEVSTHGSDAMNEPFKIEIEDHSLEDGLSKCFDTIDTVKEKLGSSSEMRQSPIRRSLRKQNISAKTAKIEEVSQKSKKSDIQYKPVSLTKNKVQIKNKVKIKNKSKVASGAGVCDICGANVSNLRAHSQTHMPLEERRKYPCEYCDKAYTDHSALRRHRNATHLGILQHCDICNIDVPNLRTHRQYKHDRDAWSEKCSICNVACISKSALDIHMARHTGEKNYQCAMCSKQFTLKGSLKLHIDSVHEKKKNYFCSNCNKGFCRKSELKEHMQTHSESRPRPWKCSECGKHLGTKGSLRVHKQLHSDIKYPCKLCGHEFAHRTYLDMHMRAHRKEKPYGCKYCDAKYARSFDRNKHQVKHHPHQIDAPAHATATYKRQ